MKFVLVLAAVLAVAVADVSLLRKGFVPPRTASFSGGANLAAPRYSGQDESQAPILKLVNEQQDDGSFHFEYETGNQIKMEQSGHLENVGTENEEQVMHGSYSYTGPDGVVYSVSYVADSNGFRAFGDHLPKAPEV
ncbi:cuticle protein CP14.6-like [Ctenocephalides felis]|uniref:cuticle protein CP14.6-like n=1 Tax=Ctenocephalides felis TaxID=7515 RepID=UPI000E6E35DF|nr:cuticle protein CP14.6-like [Ctenocephalides felis]